MSVDAFHIDGDGSGLRSHVHKFSTARRPDHAGSLVLTRPFQDFQPESHPFLNESFGTAMNQNVSFSGTPEIIHNGGTSTEWDAAGPGNWNFASGGKVVLTAGNDADAATFSEEGATTVDWANFTAFTGKIDLDTYDSNNQDFTLQWDLAGVEVGDAVTMNQLIDTGDFAEQNFVIPKSFFNFGTTVVDGLTLTLNRMGGTKPTVKFDDLQMEAAGDPLTYKATTPLGTRFHVTEIRIRIEDALTAVLTDGSMPNIDPSAILGAGTLTNGIIFGSVKNSKVLFSITLKELGDFFEGSDLINVTGNATNQGMTLAVRFPEPVVLLGGATENFLSFTINDDLSALTRFTASARGAIEI